MGIRLPRDRIRARPLWRRSAGESSNREIEASPEKMYRTILSLKAGTEFLEHLVDPDQDAPEFVDRFRIIRCMNTVLLKGNRIGHLAWQGPDIHNHAKFGQRRHELFVK